MIKQLVTGIWVLVVALAASYSAVLYKASHLSGTAEEAAATLQYQKTRPVTVPIIANGVVQGYIVTQFSYTVDGLLAAKVSVPPEDFILDEAFRRLYSDNGIDFHHLEKYDIAKLTADIQQATNARLGVKVIKSILIEDFNFVTKDEGDK